MYLKTALRCLTLNLCLALLSIAHAHDIWLSAEQFTLSKHDTLVVHQLAGSELDAELELELLKRITRRFELVTPSGSVNLLGELADPPAQPVKPVLKRKVDFEGLALLTMDHDFFYTELANETFLEYLDHEELKLEKFQEQVRQRQKQRERFARSMKCLIQVGKTAKGEQYKTVSGQKIEIVLRQNPYLLDPGDALAVQVLFDGKPLGNQPVRAFNRAGEQRISRLQTRTNGNGIARFTLDRAGLWLIRLVHLVPCAARFRDDCKNVDWESHWASYSFELQ